MSGKILNFELWSKLLLFNQIAEVYKLEYLKKELVDFVDFWYVSCHSCGVKKLINCVILLGVASWHARSPKLLCNKFL